MATSVKTGELMNLFLWLPWPRLLADGSGRGGVGSKPGPAGGALGNYLYP